MNLAQIRTIVRDILSAGGGSNTAIMPDDFWSDTEINYLINEGYAELWKIIKRGRQDYFVRVFRTTDAMFNTGMGQIYNPSLLRWVPGVGYYELPRDFSRMKMITDLSPNRVRLIKSDLTRSEFRILMNEKASDSTREYYYDILGLRTLVIRPIPQEERDFEFIYERSLPPLTDHSAGLVTIANGSSVATFSADANIFAFVKSGDELIVGTPQAAPSIDPSASYPMIRSVDNETQVTLDAVYHGQTVTSAKYIVSSTPHIPRMHHNILVAYAVKEGFRKGTNPSLEAANSWQDKFNGMLPSLVNDIEFRSDDIETVRAYLEDYDY